MSTLKKKRLLAELQYITKSRSEDLTPPLVYIKIAVNRKEYSKKEDSNKVSELDVLFSNAKEVHLD